MKNAKHKDLGQIQVELQWEGGENQIALVKAACSGKTDWFQHRNVVYRRTSNWDKAYYYCLWGAANKSISELDPIQCVTPTGRAQNLSPSIKRFNEMVKSARLVKMT
jgi:threonine synthase